MNICLCVLRIFTIRMYDKIPGKFEENIFFKFANASKFYRNANFYLVTVNSQESYNLQWEILKEESRISHQRVYNISIDRFYDLLARQNECMKALSSALPNVVDDYLGNSN